MRRLPRIGTPVAAALLTFAAMSVGAAGDPPATAPAADHYPHQSVRRQELGWGAESYWLFEPAEPMPPTAPVVVFNHGWLAVNPGAYGAWIDHLVRSGNVVVFPRYQTDAFTRPSEFLPNALAAVKDALLVLHGAAGHVRPDLTRFALIGHSAGGNLAAQMAAVAGAAGLPKARALVILMPGEVQPLREPDLSNIPADTLLVITVAEDDYVVGDVRARQIFARTTAIPPSRKKFIFYRSDLHGLPRLVAHHLAPTASLHLFDSGDGLLRGYQMTRGEVNAFDRAGFWQVADLTLHAAFAGLSLDEASAGGELFRHLGYWSDGRAVNRPVVGDDLARMPRVFPANGIRLIQWVPELPFPEPVVQAVNRPTTEAAAPDPGPLRPR